MIQVFSFYENKNCFVEVMFMRSVKTIFSKKTTTIIIITGFLVFSVATLIMISRPPFPNFDDTHALHATTRLTTQSSDVFEFDNTYALTDETKAYIENAVVFS